MSKAPSEQSLEQSLGTVTLVGAGPGDAELLTLKAARLLGEADAVVYDRLVSADVLDLIKPGAEKIYAGKGRAKHSVSQDAINDMLFDLARTHKSVVRLKGGDPFTFGRGGEEAEFLVTRGVRVEVVPGITSAAGAGASLGMPLTHRGLSTGLRYVTGSCRKGEEPDLDWASLADPDTTLIIYMGLANLGSISTRLIEAGLSPQTPAAAIENATTANERLCVATLGTLKDDVVQQNFMPPTLIIVGRVVDMVEHLQPGKV